MKNFLHWLDLGFILFIVWQGKSWSYVVGGLLVLSLLWELHRQKQREQLEAERAELLVSQQKLRDHAYVREYRKMIEEREWLER
jgi:hypothetical protein